MKKVIVETRDLDFETILTTLLSPRPHFHKQIEIVYVTNGQAIAYADQKKTLIKTGEVFITFPNQVHYYEKSIKGNYIVILFSPDLVYNMQNIFYNSVPKNNVLPKKSVQDSANMILKYAKLAGEFSATGKVGIINHFLSEIIPKYELIPRIKTNNTTLQSILDYCSENFSEDLNLDMISKNLHINKFHVSHLINEKLGMSFKKYLNNIRIHRACHLLADSENKISYISEEVGFGSIRSFNRAFKHVMNLTPSEYRELT